MLPSSKLAMARKVYHALVFGVPAEPSQAARADAPAPEELINFWKQYGVTVFSEEEKAKQISHEGLHLLNMFRLEEKGWLEHYYEPMQKVIEKLRKRQGDNPECAGILNALEQEAVIYRKFKKFYGYTFFVMQKPQVTKDKW